jgi:hypothetical protein
MKGIKEILKQAEGKKYTYFQITIPNGLYCQPVIEDLTIHYINDKVAQIADPIVNVDQLVHIPLNNVESIEEISKDKFEIIDAESEYLITYKDGMEIYISIFDE